MFFLKDFDKNEILICDFCGKDLDLFYIEDYQNENFDNFKIYTFDCYFHRSSSLKKRKKYVGNFSNDISIKINSTVEISNLIRTYNNLLYIYNFLVDFKLPFYVKKRNWVNAYVRVDGFLNSVPFGVYYNHPNYSINNNGHIYDYDKNEWILFDLKNTVK